MFVRRLISMLHKRKDSLEKLKLILIRDISASPEGGLSISPRSKPRTGYVYYQTDGHGQRIYIKKNSDHLEEKLANKEYARKLLTLIEKEIRLIDRYLKFLSHDCPEDLYPSLSEARKALVIPFIYPDEDYVSQWKAKPYTGKDFPEDGPEHFTESGLRVRSKSEELIANALDQMNIPYKYECPVNVKDWGLVYPDFTVLDVENRKEIIWEHFGRMDDPVYAENAVKKIAKYLAEGYYPGDNLILTFETSDIAISTRQIAGICRHYFLR